MNEISVSKNVIDIYKKLLLSKINDINFWNLSDNNTIYSNFINNEKEIFFVINFNKGDYYLFNKIIEIWIKNPRLSIFHIDLYPTSSLYYKLKKLKKMLINKNEIIKMKEKEKELLDALPEAVIRSIKIKKIKNI